MRLYQVATQIYTFWAVLFFHGFEVANEKQSKYPKFQVIQLDIVG